MNRKTIEEQKLSRHSALECGSHNPASTMTVTQQNLPTKNGKYRHPQDASFVPSKKCFQKNTFIKPVVVALSHHVSNSSKDRFEFHLGISILIVQNWKQFLAIQTAGRWVMCVAYACVKPYRRKWQGEDINYLFSLKNYLPYRDLNLGPSRVPSLCATNWAIQAWISNHKTIFP